MSRERGQTAEKVDQILNQNSFLEFNCIIRPMFLIFTPCTPRRYRKQLQFPGLELPILPSPATLLHPSHFLQVLPFPQLIQTILKLKQRGYCRALQPKNAYFLFMINSSITADVFIIRSYLNVFVESKMFGIIKYILVNLCVCGPLWGVGRKVEPREEGHISTRVSSRKKGIYIIEISINDCYQQLSYQ